MPPSNNGSDGGDLSDTSDSDRSSSGNDGQPSGPGRGRRPSVIPDGVGDDDGNWSLEPSDGKHSPVLATAGAVYEQS